MVFVLLLKKPQLKYVYTLPRKTLTLLFIAKYFLQFWDWFVRITPLDFHWKHHPSYVVAQFAFIFGGVATLIHGTSNEGEVLIITIKNFSCN